MVQRRYNRAKTSTPRSKKGPKAKSKYAKGQEKSNNMKKRRSCLAKSKMNNAGGIYVVTKRIGRGENETMENLNMETSRFVGMRETWAGYSGGRNLKENHTDE